MKISALTESSSLRFECFVPIEQISDEEKKIIRAILSKFADYFGKHLIVHDSIRNVTKSGDSAVTYRPKTKYRSKGFQRFRIRNEREFSGIFNDLAEKLEFAVKLLGKERKQKLESIINDLDGVEDPLRIGIGPFFIPLKMLCQKEGKR